jgi:hypothetical protein
MSSEFSLITESIKLESELTKTCRKIEEEVCMETLGEQLETGGKFYLLK